MSEYQENNTTTYIVLGVVFLLLICCSICIVSSISGSAFYYYNKNQEPPIDSTELFSISVLDRLKNLDKIKQTGGINKTGNINKIGGGLSNYIVNKKKGSSGADIDRVKGLTPDQMAEICNSDPNCKGFNTDGWFKFNMRPKSQWKNISSDMYVKKGITKYAHYKSTDSSGNDLGKVDGRGGQVAKKCDGDSKCRAFNFSDFNQNGWYKHKIKPKGDWRKGGSADFFIKQPIDGYSYEFSYDAPGNDIKSFTNTSAKKLADECNKRSECKGFAFDSKGKRGWIKKSVSKKKYVKDRGVWDSGLYIKD